MGQALKKVEFGATGKCLQYQDFFRVGRLVNLYAKHLVFLILIKNGVFLGIG